jgi:hypothetical protein
MYLKEDGIYIGMLTQGVMQLQGFNFIVPIRRIHDWAKDTKIEWAIDPKVPMPSLAVIDKIPVEDGGIMPQGLPGNASRGDSPPASSKEMLDIGDRLFRLFQ